jgi:hypothetical protein
LQSFGNLWIRVGYLHPDPLSTMTIQEPEEGGDPSRFRALQRWAAGAMMGLGGCAVMLDWLLWRTTFASAPTWAHWAVPGSGIVMFVAGERLYSHALRRLAPPSTD